MTQPIQYFEAERRLSDLIDAALRGETVLIKTESQQTVQLVPAGARVLDSEPFAVPNPPSVIEDFEDLLIDFEDYL